MTQNPTFYCAKCHATRAPLLMAGNYTCVMCGKVRTVEDYRAEFAKLRATAEKARARVTARKAAAPPPQPAPTLEASPTPSMPELEASTPAPEAQGCAWKECDQAPRGKSKYCSRSCSNKNARWRHSQRRTEP